MVKVAVWNCFLELPYEMLCKSFFNRLVDGHIWGNFSQWNSLCYNFCLLTSFHSDIFRFVYHSPKKAFYEDLNYRLNRTFPFMESIRWQWQPHFAYLLYKIASWAINCKYKISFRTNQKSEWTANCYYAPNSSEAEGVRQGLVFDDGTSKIILWCSLVLQKIMLGDVKSNRSKIFNDGISYMQMKFNERG